MLAASKALPGWSLFFVALLVFNASTASLSIRGPRRSNTSSCPSCSLGCSSRSFARVWTGLTVANLLVTLTVSLYAGEFFLAHRLEAAEQA